MQVCSDSRLIAIEFNEQIRHRMLKPGIVLMVPGSLSDHRIPAPRSAARSGGDGVFIKQVTEIVKAMLIKAGAEPVDQIRDLDAILNI